MDGFSRHFRQRFLVLAVVVSAAAAGGQEPASEATHGWDDFVRPVLERGEGGRVFFPGDPADEGIGILDPTDFAVHMTDADDPGDERVVPAGQVFVPPSGRWRYWLQGEWLMSPSSMLRITPAAEWSRTSVSTLPVVPAGKVGLDTVPEIGCDLELWLLFAGNEPGWRHHDLSRRRPVREAIEGVLMPAGPVVSALWDGCDERYLALSDEFLVVAGETIEAPLTPPAADESSALVHVTVPLGVPSEALDDFEATLLRQEQVLRPDFRVVTNWGVYQGWTGLQPGPAVLAGGSESLYLDARTVDLGGGGVVWVGEPLARRPSLEVTLVLPPQVREEPFSLEVLRLPEREPLARAELPRGAGRHRFLEGLVNAPLEVELTTNLGVYRRQIDLSTGGEASLEIAPQLIEVYGTVRHGGERQPAKLTFQTVSGQSVTAVANEDGEYSAVSLQPLTWVELRLTGGEQEPWRDFFMPPIRESRTLEFDLPDAETTVRVVDASTGEGIAGATVGVRNEHRPPDQLEPTAGGRGRVIATSHPTDGDGEVRLPPPRPGRLEIHVDATGYRSLDEPITLDVPDPPSDQELEIALDPIGATMAVRLTLPDGSPAAGAQVAHVDSLALEQTYFSARADAAGIVEIPIEPATGLLLLKHPAATFGIVPRPQWTDRERVEWTFSPAADPLTVRVLDPAAEAPAAGAAVAVWVEERRLSARAVQWLLGARSITDENGFWTANGLPRAPVRLLAISRHRVVEAATGSLDTLADEIRFPWPTRIELRAIP